MTGRVKMTRAERSEANARAWAEEKRRLRSEKETLARARAQSLPAEPGVYTFPFPARFLEFLRQRMEPTEAQAVLFGVACDGDSPDSPMGRELFGPIPIPTARARRRFVLVKGARMGGTYLSALRMLHLALTLPLDRLAPGERASALIVGPDLNLAKQGLRYARGAAEADPVIRAMLTGKDGEQGFEVCRPDGTVYVEVLAATKGGSAVRARTLVGAQLTEFGFFRDANYAVNDKEIRLAVQPRIMTGGQLIMESTPFVAAGELYAMFREQWGKSETCVAAKAPTLLMRGTDGEVAAEIAMERAANPDNAVREFDAEFISADASTFFDAGSIDRAVDPRIKLGQPPMPGMSASAGGDFAFRRNSSALVVCHRFGPAYTVADLLELKPTADAPLKPSEVVSEFAECLKVHGLDFMLSDGHYREAVREYLDASRIALVDAPSAVSLPYIRARTLFHEGTLRIPNDPQLIQQLKETRSRPLSGGGVQIIPAKSPDGRHGDIVSALVLAVWTHAVAETLPAMAQPGTQAYEEQRARQFFDKRRDEIQKRQAEEAESDEYGLFDGDD